MSTAESLTIETDFGLNNDPDLLTDIDSDPTDLGLFDDCYDPDLLTCDEANCITNPQPSWQIQKLMAIATAVINREPIDVAKSTRIQIKSLGLLPELGDYKLN